MKKLFVFIASIGFCFNLIAQQPKEGLYQSSDGHYQFSLVNLNDSSIEVTESNKTSVYNKNGDAFQHSEAKYSNYMMKVESPTTLIAYNSTINNGTKYNWISNLSLTEEDCPLAEKYQELAANVNDPEVQAYSFCAAAALMKCSYTQEGFAAYAAGIAQTLKLIMVDPSKCPCEDVISKEIWSQN